jgi:type IV pilus assembly protein PilV
MLSQKYSGQHSGMALLEVLISIVVLSFGLLGLAGLQIAGMKSNQTAYLRSVATAAAYDMADRMRANMAGVKAGNYDSITATIPASPSTTCTGSGCTPAQLATFDATNWLFSYALPGGTGNVTKKANSNLFVISVNWTEKCQQGECPSGYLTRSFTTEIAP